MIEDESPSGEDLASDVSSIPGINDVVPKTAEPGLKQELPRPLTETPNQVQGNDE